MIFDYGRHPSAARATEPATDVPYRQAVGAFVNLAADDGVVTYDTKSRQLHPIDPKYAKDIATTIAGLKQCRLEVLGSRGNAGKTWRYKIQILLKGTGQGGMTFTPDQIIDVFKFALEHDFWRTYVFDPTGLVKHAHKLWVGDEFVAWSLRNNRPEGNRPRNTVLSTSDARRKKGRIAADSGADLSDWDSDDDY